MRKTFAPAAFLVFVLAGASAIALDLSQESTWGGPNEDEADEIAIAPDGSTYVAGTTFSFGAGGSDAFLLKYSATGVLEWQRTYGSAVVPPFFSPNDFGTGVAAAPDGSVYLTGHLSADGLFVAKFDPGGNLVWQRTWGDSGHFSRAVEVAADGSVYVGGGTFAFGVGQADALLLKFAPDGTIVWARTWGGPSREDVADVAIGADGGIYMVGETGSFFWNDAFIVKFAPDGTLLWQRDWGTMGAVTPNSSAAWGVGTAHDGSVYITGTSSMADRSMVVVKFDADGTLLWERLAGPPFIIGFDVAAAADGSVYVTGYGNFEPQHVDTFVIKLLPTGRAREGLTWGGSESGAGKSIAVAPDGSILVAGDARTPPHVTNRVAPRMTTLAGFLIAPGGTVTTPAELVRIPLGIVTVPDGSTTFGGATDAMLLRVQP